MGQASEIFELGAIVKEAAKCIVEPRNVVAGSVGEVEAANADGRQSGLGSELVEEALKMVKLAKCQPSRGIGAKDEQHVHWRERWKG